MEFVAIDFETANSNRGSVCSIGIVEFKDFKIVNEQYYLINPEEEFDDFNILIHGITPELVENEKSFPSVWNHILMTLNDRVVVAHNASFDISVLRHVLDKYSLEYPELKYSCTRILSKKTWEGLHNYKLSTVASYNNIKFIHHNALEDAKACGHIFCEIFKTHNSENIEDLHRKLRVNTGNLYKEGYSPAALKNSNNSCHTRDIKPSFEDFDEEHEFYHKSIVFTGTLESMTRKEAMQKVVDVGGLCGDSVSKVTNYLVVGIQDYSKFTDGQKSSKMKKAEKLIESGQALEIIGEDEFLRIL